MAVDKNLNLPAWYRDHEPNAERRAPMGNLFRKVGNRWFIVYEGVVCQLRATKGLDYLTLLLRHPGREFPVSEVLRSVNASRHHANGAADMIAESIRVAHPAHNGDGASLGGNSQRARMSELERSRLAVTKPIKNSVQRIREANPPLGRHLSLSIKTGYVCGYLPVAGELATWSID